MDCRSTFFLFVFTMALVMKAWFRCVAAALGDPAPAQTVAGVMLLLLVLYTGYTVPKPSQIRALKWISYINVSDCQQILLPVLISGQPIRYGFEGLMSNEFHTLDGTCSNLIPSGAGYENALLANQVCGTVGSIPGQSTVNGNTFIAISYDYSYSHIWRVSDVTLNLIFVETDIGVELRHRHRVWHRVCRSTPLFLRIQHPLVWRDEHHALQARHEDSNCARRPRES
jgi:ABC-type multidrug transport system permease subunit